MGQSVVLDEAEIAKASNQITTYAEFLTGIIEEYVKILMDVPKEKAIVDVLICTELLDLIRKVTPYKFQICQTGDDVSEAMKDIYAEVESADDFKYPGEFMATVSALLANFL